jgi:hypothetical protein
MQFIAKLSQFCNDPPPPPDPLSYVQWATRLLPPVQRVVRAYFLFYFFICICFVIIILFGWLHLLFTNKKLTFIIYIKITNHQNKIV